MFGILCFGDSITQGRGESPSLGWVGRLKNDFEGKDYYNVLYNLGIPGDTSTELLNRFEIELKNRVKYIRERDKFVVIIAIGINDSRGLGKPNNNETSLIEYERNIQELITISKKFTNDIFLISLTPVDEDLVCPYEETYFSNKVIVEYNSVVEKNCLKNNCKYIDIFDDLYKLNYKKLLDDGIHFNSKGYEKIFNLIKSKFIKFQIISK